MGETGLQSISMPLTSSAAVTCLGGTVSHITPVLMWYVYVLPPSLTPPFEIDGTCVAMSGTRLVGIDVVPVAGYVTSWRV